MSAAHPVVTFDLVESRVSAQDAADYARPNDVADLAEKVVAILEDESRRMRMGTAGRRRIETELAWEHQRQHLITAYELLLSD